MIAQRRRNMKSILILLIPLFCISCHPRSSQRDVDVSLDRAFDMFTRSQYAQVLEVLDRIQLVAPSNYLIYETRAWTLYVMKGGDQSDEMILSNLNTAIGLDPFKAAQSYHLRGVIHQGQRSLDSAIQDYSKAIELLPNEPRMYNSYMGRGGYSLRRPTMSPPSKMPSGRQNCSRPNISPIFLWLWPIRILITARRRSNG